MNYADCFSYGCIPADGANHLVTVYNRMMPGPQIEVCIYDTVIVRVHNELGDVATSIHWHGMHQRYTNYMDGVPFITQCPVHPNNVFQYRFEAFPSGTHWYHSHIGNQRVNGAYGALIVREPNQDNVQRSLYDVDSSDHVIVLLEINERSPDVLFYEEYRLRQFPENVVTAVLVNRFGWDENNAIPPARFNVQRGLRYRFRFVNGGFRVCPIKITIDNHNMTVISSDGYDTTPYTVQTLYINNGERFDIVVTANQDGGTFWMRFLGLMDCENKEGRAILRYVTDPNAPEPAILPEPTTNATANAGMIMNCINVPNDVPNCWDMSKVKSAVSSSRYCGIPSFKYFFNLDTIRYALPEFAGPMDDVLTAPVVNNISFVFPSTPLNQEYQPQIFCNGCNNAAGPRICQCTHVVQIPLYSLVELIIVDEGSVFDLSHPFHLHGYEFVVIGQDRLGTNTTFQQVRDLDNRGLLKRNCTNPVRKDTVSIPDGGYVIIRFYADNPGYWLTHCHVEHHMEVGMGFVLQTGPNLIPPLNFPRCGNYLG
ncbi:PREDICTED: laccase-1-like [Nicrophorus vespilloides]|uniref:Laccase-1-like n=1 Tax=Nicrophorus vespilloides TaxID=110193 RepID=A0ABM1M7Z8_NICVS|nr:PREDICTED: laccase-1-like [Nicrophorus vespilloides]